MPKTKPYCFPGTSRGSIGASVALLSVLSSTGCWMKNPSIPMARDFERQLPESAAQCRPGSIQNSRLTRVRYEADTVGAGLECRSETQKKNCVNGVIGAWSGTFGFESCRVRTTAPISDKISGPTSQGDLVTLSTPETGATIHYTLDGSEPTAESELYASPIALSQDVVLKAVAVREGFAESDVLVLSFEVFKRCGSLAHASLENRIRYASAAADVAAGGCQSETQTRACTDGSLESWSGTFLEVGCIPKAGTPMVDIPPGNYSVPISIALSSVPSDATILYTVDGTDPAASGLTYSAPISLSNNATLRAITRKAGHADSAVADFTYVISATQASSVTFSPPGSISQSAPSVTLSSATSGATLRYTTDGSAPNGSSAQYSAPLMLTTEGTTTIQAFASHPMHSDSGLTSATYTVDLTPPVPGGAGAVTPSSVTTTGFRLDWTAASDSLTPANSLSYKVVRANAAADIDTVGELNAVSGADLLLDWSGNSTNVIVGGFSPGTSHAVSIAVRDDSGRTSIYGPATVHLVTAAPDAPARTATHDSVTLSFNPVTGASSYLVYHSTSPGVSTSDASTTCASPPCTVGSLSANTTFYFRVVAVNASSIASALSSEVSRATLAVNSQRAFVTSMTYPGFSIGGLTGGDALCSARAVAAGLGGTWRAILSDGSTDAADRIPVTRPIVNMSGATIATSSGDLWDTSLGAPIRYDEFGADVGADYAWTGTHEQGWALSDRCGDWASASGTGRLGATNATDDTWAYSYSDRGCSQAARLYCVEE